jgi:hypothetical protein
MDTITLSWDGPHRFADFLDEVSFPWAHKAGLYFWVAPYESRDIEAVTYVGKASGSPSLLKRQRDHYANYIGGRYVIPGIFRGCGEIWIPNQYPSVKSIMTDRNAWLELISECIDYVASVRIYVCPLPDSDKSTIARLERELIFDMQPKVNSRGKARKPTADLAIRHENMPDFI